MLTIGDKLPEFSLQAVKSGVVPENFIALKLLKYVKNAIVEKKKFIKILT